MRRRFWYLGAKEQFLLLQKTLLQMLFHRLDRFGDGGSGILIQFRLAEP